MIPTRLPLAALVLLGPPVLAQSVAPPVDPASHVVGQVLVKVRPGAEAALLGEPARRVFEPRGNDAVGLARVHALEVPAGTEADRVRALEAAPWVEWASLLRTDGGITGALVPNDPEFANQWHLDQASDVDIDASEGWDLRGGFEASASLVVAVIDTGYEITGSSPEFAGSVWLNEDESLDGADGDQNGFVDDVAGYDFVEDDFDPDPDHPHGVWVAGAMAARTNNSSEIAGVASGVRIMPLKAFDQSGGFPTGGTYPGHLSAATALMYAADNDADLVNNSWYNGTTSSQVINDAIQYALDNGVRLVFSAANNDTTAAWPGMYPGLLVVAAIENTGQKWFASNYGPWVTVSAPGTAVLTTTLGPWGPVPFDGTSAAAPLVSGIVAHLLSEDPDLTQAELVALVSEGCEDVDGFNPGYVGQLGAGIANLRGSLERLQMTTDLGQQLAGSTAPNLNAWGGSTAGDTLTWSLSGAAPGSVGGFAFGATASNLPIFGGTLVPTPNVVVGFVVQPDGSYVLEHTLFGSLPSGPAVWTQFGGLDAGAPEGVQLSNAVLISG